MAGSMTVEKQKKPETSTSGGPLAPVRGLPAALTRLRDEFDRLFDHFPFNLPSAWRHIENGWRWDVQVEDKENAVVVRAEAPGFEAGDFDIQAQEGYLTMRASRKCETKKDEGYERSECECYHSINLPAGIDKDKVEASYHNGILTVTVPKTSEGKGRRVPVKNA